MSSPLAAPGLPIAAVEQSTGIARATLRIWERRYGFPRPGRDPRGERCYPGDQVDRLRSIAELMARGHRPGRLVGLTPAQLGALAGSGAADIAPVGGATALHQPADPVLRLVRSHDAAGLLRHLEGSMRSLGLRGFVTARMPELNTLVGACWASGELQVYEEHIYTEAVQQVLRTAIAGQPPGPDATPRVLLATFPDEGHGLGLLMAQAMFALEGCACTSLGLKVPVGQVAAAAEAVGADIVGISSSACAKPAHLMRGLERLRGDLPPEVAIWAGGSAPVLGRRRIPGVQAIRHVADIPAALRAWREATLTAE
ncbi:MAG: MerR family transcriptional regulator [Comamonadaceae bacterium]|nr:MAG: MerR family transcriptional regulator [Comamonadaceae bacterium]